MEGIVHVVENMRTILITAQVLKMLIKWRLKVLGKNELGRPIVV